jgi:hypothetical protein
MNENVERRLARNEDLFRRTNEAVVQGLWPGEKRGPLRLRCECASLDCQRTLEIELEEYDTIRESPDRFVLCAGHENPDIERVVERCPGYVVVEKVGAAADEVERLDRRDRGD